MFTARTPVVTSGDVNVRVASHLSKVPWIATDAFTLNAIELPACVIANTGASCARLSDGSRADATRQVATNTVFIFLNDYTSIRQLLDGSCIFCNAWSRLKLPGLARGGNSLKVCRNCPTIACAGTNAHALSIR